MKKSILHAIKIAAIAVTAALLCAGCADNSEARPGGLVDRFLGAPLPVYKVTFDSLHGGSIDPQEISEGGKVKKPADPTRYGHTFSYWYMNRYSSYDGSNRTQWQFDSYIVTENITLYAYWERKQYKVKFDAQGGNNVYVVGVGGNFNTTTNYWDSISVKYGDTVGTPSTTSRNGYTFGGWYIDDTTFTTKWDFSKSVVTSDTTLYAKWTIIRYRINFNPNGGTVTPGFDSTDIGYKLDSLPIPTRALYNFEGWFFTSSIVNASQEKITTNTTFGRDTTIYARWTGIPTPNKTSFVDSRDNTTYQQVTIGTQVWMAENLNYAGEEGKTIGSCYNECKNGRLYNWVTAMDIDNVYSGSYWEGNDVNHQGVCPTGWHLPNGAEWDTLIDYVGGASMASKRLTPRTTAWNYEGTDEYGFSALPSLNHISYYAGYWWSATESNAGNAIRLYINSYMIRDQSPLTVGSSTKSQSYSVRCVQD